MKRKFKFYSNSDLPLSLFLVSLSVFAQTPGTFTAAGFMTTARANHTATLLQDGRVLIVGGDQTGTAELYDPAAGIFSPTGNMTIGHGGWPYSSESTATLLPDGQVLIVGTKSELYDPVSGSFTNTANQLIGTFELAATLLTNGKVLFTGGSIPQLYDPSTRMFGLAGPYADTASSIFALIGAAPLLPDGRVLMPSEPVAELYDPVTNTFSLTGSMGDDLYVNRTATLMTNGKVLVAGGAPFPSDIDYGPVNIAEVFDASTGTFIGTGSMQFERKSHAATLLPDRTVLITGGEVDSWFDGSPFAELYNPSTGAFFAVIDMKAARSSHQATLLNDGRVLITGGIFTGPYSVTEQSIHNSAEIYNPPALVPAPALLSLSGDGKGQGAIQHAGTTRIASASDPAVAGEYLTIYLTGLTDGGVIPPQVAIGGQLAEISFFGSVPGYPSLDQINVRMPSGIAPGPAVPVRLAYLSRQSNEVTIGVH